MSESDEKTHVLSSDEMWEKAGQSGSICRADLGIQNKKISDGTTTLNEGFQKWTYTHDEE